MQILAVIQVDGSSISPIFHWLKLSHVAPSLQGDGTAGVHEQDDLCHKTK